MKDLLESLQIDPAQRTQRSGAAKMKQRPKLAKGSFAVVIASVVGLAVVGYIRIAGARPVSVDVYTVTTPREGVGAPTLTAGGYVKDATVVYVVPRVSGRIASLLVAEGEQVKAGTLIARLETRDLRQALEEASANWLQAQANLAKLRQGPRAEEIAEMRAKVAAARLAKERSYKEFVRSRALLESGVLAQQTFDQINTEYLVSDKALEATQQSLALLEAGTRSEEIKMAEAALDATHARLEAARNRYSYAEIRAPISGRILRKYRESGDYVSPDVPFLQGYDTVAVGSPIVAIASLDNQEVSVDINETDIAKVSLHQRVEVSPNGFSSEVLHGSVTRISPRADKNKNTIEVRVTFDNSARSLPYDMSVKLTFLAPGLGAPTEHIASPQIPSGGLVSRGKEAFVFVAIDSHARLRPVIVRPDGGGMLTVLTGLTEGDQVIVSSSRDLKDGDRIAVKSAN